MIEIEVNNVRSKIVGEVPDAVLRKLNSVLSYEIPGAHYARMRNPYAGTVHLFSSTGQTFPTGLLHRVIEVLSKAGVSCHLRDKRPPVTLGQELPVKGITFRDYQQESIDVAVKKQRGIIKVGTGGGKTNIFIGIVAKLNVPTLILIHKTDVFYQIIDRLEAALGIHVGRIGDDVKDIQPISVAMIQSLSSCFVTGRRKKVTENGVAKEVFIMDSPEVLQEKEKVLDYIKSAQCIITDECHHVPSDSFSMVLKKAENAFYRLGMSASPWREDNADLLIEAHQGKILIDVSASRLIKENFLVPPLVQLYLFKHPRKSRDNMKYFEIYDREVVNNSERNKVIVEAALKASGEGKTVLIAIQKVEHGEILERMLKGVDDTAIFVYGESESEIRRDVLKELNERKRKIVICTTIFGEGIDVPTLDVLINAKAAASSVDSFQLIGRVLRKPTGKNKAYLVDIFDSGCRFLEAHAKARERIYKTEPEYILRDVTSVNDLEFKDSTW
jgi:superfamily II DNA or RNA helicase